MEQILKSASQWPRGTPSPSWSDPEVCSLFQAERGRPGEGFRLWYDTYARILEALPEPMRTGLDPQTNRTMRLALRCRFTASDGKSASFLCDGDTDSQVLGRERSDTDQAKRLVQGQILPQLIPEFLRSLVPEEIRACSREELSVWVQTDPMQFLPPQDLSAAKLPAKVQGRFGPIAHTAVGELLEMLVAKGVLALWEFSYWSAASGRTETSRYYWPVPVSEGVPASVAAVPAYEQNAESSTRTADATPGEDAHPSMERATAPDATGYLASPPDPSGYVSVTDIVSKHTPAEMALAVKHLTSILEDYAWNRIRWTRPAGKDGKPRPNRRSVHLADWLAYLERRRAADDDGWPTVSKHEIAERAGVIRQSKSVGK